MILRRHKRHNNHSKRDIDSNIYSNINSYRLHADNLRWTLWIGYAAFYGAIISFLNSTNKMTDQEIGYICIAAFVISVFYFLILTVQNWFYNAFAQFCDECKENLINGKRIRTIKMFMITEGKNITPLHPAYSFALLIVVITGSWFIITAIKFLCQSYWSDINYWGWVKFLLISGIYTFMIASTFELLKNWDRAVYKTIINKVSNYYK